MLSTADGWMAEQNWEGVGWILFEHGIVENLYNLIETLVAPLYYDNPAEWQTRMQKTRGIVLNHYTAERMVRDYLDKLYFPA
jgi:starch phosphorylase